MSKSSAAPGSCGRSASARSEVVGRVALRYRAHLNARDDVPWGLGETAEQREKFRALASAERLERRLGDALPEGQHLAGERRARFGDAQGRAPAILGIA